MWYVICSTTWKVVLECPTENEAKEYCDENEDCFYQYSEYLLR